MVLILWCIIQDIIHAPPIYRFETEGEIKTNGLFKVKEADITIKIMNTSETVVLVEEKLHLENTTRFELKKDYTKEELGVYPSLNVVVEVDSIKFNNMPTLIISLIIIGVAIINFTVTLISQQKEKKQQKKLEEQQKIE